MHIIIKFTYANSLLFDSALYCTVHLYVVLKYDCFQRLQVEKLYLTLSYSLITGGGGDIKTVFVVLHMAVARVPSYRAMRSSCAISLSHGACSCCVLQQPGWVPGLDVQHCEMLGRGAAGNMDAHRYRHRSLSTHATPLQ